MCACIDVVMILFSSTTVSFGLLSVIVIIAVAICLLIAVIYNYKDTSCEFRSSHTRESVCEDVGCAM